MNHALSVIVFSKDRPLQLHGYLESLIFYSGINQSCITAVVKENEFIDYGNVKKAFQDVKWVIQGDFYTDLINVINNSKDFILFGCDDVVFTKKFDLNLAIEILQEDKDIFGLSLRLGKNIKPVPNDLENHKEYISWDWTRTDAPHWNYPWELDATIYRKIDILNLLAKIPSSQLKNPNFLEGLIADDSQKTKELIRRKKLSSFYTSNCVVITVNRVQETHPNNFDSTGHSDIYSLNKEYSRGNRLDIPAISKMNKNVIHVGADYFILTLRKKGFYLMKLRKWLGKIKKIIKKNL